MSSVMIDTERGVVCASGDLDIQCAPMMRNALHQVCDLDGSDVVIDMSGVTFMDSTGLRELLKVTSDGHNVTLLGVPRQVRVLLDLAGVDSLFTIV